MEFEAIAVKDKIRRIRHCYGDILDNLPEIGTFRFDCRTRGRMSSDCWNLMLRYWIKAVHDPYSLCDCKIGSDCQLIYEICDFVEQHTVAMKIDGKSLFSRPEPKLGFRRIKDLTVELYNRTYKTTGLEYCKDFYKREIRDFYDMISEDIVWLQVKGMAMCEAFVWYQHWKLTKNRESVCGLDDPDVSRTIIEDGHFEYAIYSGEELEATATQVY